jgi:hypothetical protein
VPSLMFWIASLNFCTCADASERMEAGVDVLKDKRGADIPRGLSSLAEVRVHLKMLNHQNVISFSLF